MGRLEKLSNYCQRKEGEEYCCQMSLSPIKSLLKSKHPQAMPLNTIAVDHNSDQPPEIHPVVHDRIDAKLIKCFTLSTSGAAGPLGLDTKDWKHMCSSFKSASDDLCHALSEVAK